MGEGEGHAVNRALDVALAGAGLVLASPLLAGAALATKLGDRGPVLYRQTRVGRNGEDFEMLKLRTMVVGAEGMGAGPAVDHGDSRITRVGPILRRTSIDELPQLWNVVRGDMSLVGPRPALRYQVEQYEERQRRRLEVRPGLTGWAQVNGRATLSWPERIELDVWYVDNRSPVLDLKILLRTPLALFRGTYRGATGGWRSALLDRRAGPFGTGASSQRLTLELPQTNVHACQNGQPGDRAVPRGGRPTEHELRSARLRSAAVTAVLFTCAGQRVDIVRAFKDAGATTVAADLDPLAPALFHADSAVSVPRIDDAGYVPALAELVREHDIRLLVPLTDLDHAILARSRDELGPRSSSSPTRTPASACPTSSRRTASSSGTASRRRAAGRRRTCRRTPATRCS